MSSSLHIRALLAASLSVAALTGCAAQTPAASTPAVTPPTTSPSVASTPSVSPAVFTGLDALTSYRGLAKESCSYAQSAGVVETITGIAKPVTVVMIPKADAYRDFSAAYFTAPDDFQPIFETDALAVCADEMTFSLTEESGTQLADLKGITVTQRVAGDTVDPTFTVTYTLYGEATVTRYTAHDNVMIKAEELTAAGKVTSTRAIRYGTTEKDRAIIVTATDRFLAKN